VAAVRDVRHPTPIAFPAQGEWCVERRGADGTIELVKAGGDPWRGTEEQARDRARILGEEDPGARDTAKRAP
jgi:hypothetical protein